MTTAKPCLIDAYRYDDQGYLDGMTMWQLEGDEYNPSPNSTDICPWGEGQPDESVFYRFVDGAWTTEPKPTCAEDIVGIAVSHTSNTEHDIAMRDFVRKFSKAEGFREKRGEALEWICEKIPEEEIAAREIESELSSFDAQIANLKDRMATAMLMGDQEQVAALQAEYNALMNGE